jgi:hypothetical protein
MEMEGTKMKRFSEFKVGPDYQERYHEAMTELGGEAKSGGKKHVFVHDNSEKENEIHRSLKSLGYTHIPEQREYEKRLNTRDGGYHIVKKDTKFRGGKWHTTLENHTEKASKGKDFY